MAARGGTRVKGKGGYSAFVPSKTSAGVQELRAQAKEAGLTLRVMSTPDSMGNVYNARGEKSDIYAKTQRGMREMVADNVRRRRADDQSLADMRAERTMTPTQVSQAVADRASRAGANLATNDMRRIRRLARDVESGKAPRWKLDGAVEKVRWQITAARAKKR